MSERRMDSIEHIIARWGLSRRDVLAIMLFCHHRSGPSLIRGLFDFVRGLGPAATASGRLGVRCVPAAGR